MKHPPDLLPEDFQNALRELDSYIDVTLEDLMQINRAAQKHAQLRQAERLLVKDIMTKEVVTVTADTPLRDAARLLLDLRISGLPVVDHDDKLIGIVTEADFLTAMGIPCHHPAHSLWQTLENMFRQQANPGDAPDRVSDIMAKQVISISHQSSLHEAIDLMKQHHVKRIVVTDTEQKIQGIITRTNLVSVLLQRIL